MASKKQQHDFRLKGTSLIALCLAGVSQVQMAHGQEGDAIVVTGSRIGGVAPVGAAVTALGREEIETTGAVTLDRMIRELPQVFDLGFSENSRAQSGGNGNATFSNSVNLRGLGPFSTLIIMDGHRMTSNGRAIDPSVLPTLGVERVEVIADGASAIYGSDAVAGVVNLIPRRTLDGGEAYARIAPTGDGDFWEWSAGIALGKVFDRGQIMVAFEHAFRSNLSGDDRDFFTSDQTASGGPDYRINACSPGTLVYGGQTYALPDSLTTANVANLTAGTQNLCEAQAGQDLFPEQKYNSLSSTATYEITDNIALLFDGYYSKREFVRTPGAITSTLAVPETNAFFIAPAFYTPGSGGYQIAYNFQNDISLDQLVGYQENWQITPGLRVELPHDWTFEARVGYGKATDRADAGFGLNRNALAAALNSSDPATAFDPYGGGRTASSTIAGMFDAEANFPTNGELTTFQAGFDGPLFEIPGGDIRLAAGYERQDFTMILGQGTPAPREYNRKVDSAYLEVLLPLVGPENAMSGIQDLELNVAVRYDDYSDVGHTTNPKIGVNWVPTDGVKFRASYGTSFRAPTFPEIFGNSSRLYVQAYTNPDPNGPPRISGYTYGSGPNPDLGPETATTWTMGVDLDLVENMKLGLTYFDIAYKDTIAGLLSNLSVLTLADEYAGTDVILFGQAAYDRLNDLITNEGKTILQFPGTSRACDSGADIASCIFVDGRSLNLGRAKMKGIDLNAQYWMEVSAQDSLTFMVNATYLTAYKVAFTPGGDPVSLRNQIFNPMKFKARASVTWERGAYSARLQATHVNGYTNTLVNPNESVGSYTPVDFALTWRASDSFDTGFLDRLSVTFEVRNLFDTDPPYVNVAPASNGSGGYDATNTNPIGRLFSLAVRTEF